MKQFSVSNIILQNTLTPQAEIHVAFDLGKIERCGAF